MESALAQDFKNQEEAREFLYGRIFEYLSPEAHLIFCAAGQLVSEKDLTNLLSKLRYVVNMDGNEEGFRNCIRELLDLRIIEVVHEEFFSVYSVEILGIMKKRFLDIHASKKGDIIHRVQQVKPDKAQDVEQALLRRADEARTTNSPQDVEAMYREILNRSRSPKDIRSKALRNLASYFWSERDNKERAIELLEQHIHMEEFRYEPELAKLLANLHWQCRNGDKAIEVLYQYFGPNIWERDGRESSMELLGLWLMFRSKLIVERSENIEARSRTENWDEQRYHGQCKNVFQDFRTLFNRFGRPLFHRVRQSGLKELAPGEHHNIITGLYHFSGACLRFEESDLAMEICDFALRNGKTGTMTQEFQRRRKLARQGFKPSRREGGRVPRLKGPTAMSEAFDRAGRGRSP